MSKTAKTLLVTVLTVSMMIIGPVSAIAIPFPPAVEPPMTFSSIDMTADYAAEVGTDVAEITAIGCGIGDGRTLIAGLDTNGDITLADWDGNQFNDWTEDWDYYIEDQYDWEWTRITSIVYFNSDYIVGGSRNVDGTDEAVVAYLCGSCYPGGDHEQVFNDSTLSGHTSVTGMSYDADSDKLGITVSGSNGMLVWNDAADYYDDFENISEMAGATAPITLYGNSIDFGAINSMETERADTSALSGAVKSLIFPPYWVTGTATGSVLAMGSSGSGEILPQTLTSPGVGQVLSLDYDWPDSAWLVGVAGSDGVMKLFRDTRSPALEAATVEPASTDLNFPATINANADGEFIGPYFLVGGTGPGGAHLYKWKQVSAEFIDFDYLVEGMSKINAIVLDYGTMALSGTYIEENFFVGGAGSSTLLYLTETPMFDETPIPSGTGATVECGDGTASVVVPDGAINTDYNILVEKVASGTPAVPSGLSLLGNSYQFECFDSSGLPVTTFDAEVTITIHYDEADLNGMSEDSLIIYWYNLDTSAWEAIVPSVVDKVNNTVTIQVSHFSQFGILGATALEMPYTGK